MGVAHTCSKAPKDDIIVSPHIFLCFQGPEHLPMYLKGKLQTPSQDAGCPDFDVLPLYFRSIVMISKVSVIAPGDQVTVPSSKM